MNATRKRKLVRGIAFLFLVGVSCLAYGYQDELKEAIKVVLESKWSMALASIYVISCAVMYQIFVGGNSDFGGIIHAHFGKYADFVFAVVTYVPASATSLALLKGLFMQEFFNQTYFSGFDRIDMTSIFVVSSYLLYYSLFNSTKLLIAAISQVDAVSVSKVTDAT